MYSRSDIRNIFYSVAIVIIFSLLFTSCVSEAPLMYQSQFQNQVSFNKWDLNVNGSLSKDELHTGIYKTINDGGNRFISEDEWKEAYYYFQTYTAKDYGYFTKWDANRDNRLNSNEFEECFSSSKLYGAWDKNSNGKIGREEFSAGLFDTWDINNDATLSSYEAESWQEAAL